MSGRTTIQYQSAIQELQEMFPEHSKNLIEGTLRSVNLSIDAAIAILLDTPPDKASHPSRPAPAPVQAPPPSQPHKPAAAPIKQHIFPADFLRWPPNATTIKVSIQPTDVTGGASSVSYPQPTQQLPQSPQLFDLDMNSIQNESKQPASGWAKFKARFSKKGYEQI